jgi:HEAT repeat protein
VGFVQFVDARAADQQTLANELALENKNMTHRSWRWIAAGLLAAALLAVPAATALAADEIDDAKVAKAIQAAQRWKFGDGTGDLQYLAGVVVQAAQDPAARKKVEAHMIDGLAGAKTRGGIDFFCRQLVIVGTEAAIPMLAERLGEAESSHMARYALERIPGKAADAALLKAFAAVDEKLKVGVVYSLGRRRCKAAARPIAALLSSRNEDLLVASLVALSRIDSDDAVAAVAKARESVPAKVRPAATAALLDCAKRLSGQPARAGEAAAIYKRLFAATEPTMCRIAALTSMVAAQGDKAASLALAAMIDKDPKVREVAIPTLRGVPGRQVTRAIVASLPDHAESVQAMLLAVLADRGDKSALPAIVKAARSPSAVLRLAALDALPKLGDASVVPMLAQLAATAARREEQKAARSGLVNLTGRDINAAIVRALGSAEAGARVELLRSLATRQAEDQVPAVLKAAGDKDAAVKAEAMRTLRALAGAEHTPVLVRFLTRVTDDKVRGEAESAVVTAAKKIPDADNPPAAVLAAVRSAATPAVKASLIRVLGRIGHAAALPRITAAAKDANVDVKDAAIRALADWPTAAPAKALVAIAADMAATQPHRIIALRGYIGMIHKQGELTDEQILADYAKALSMAARAEEKRLVLSRLAVLRHRGALDMARRCAQDAALKDAADAAVKKIEHLLSAPAKVTASHKPEAANSAIDGNPSTRWDTGAAMRGGEWFKLDLGEEKLISGITLDTRGSAGDYPRGWEVYVSKSTLGQGRLVAKGKGTSPVTEIKFPQPARGKAIKIVQTGRTEGLFWSIHELQIHSEPVRR